MISILQMQTLSFRESPVTHVRSCRKFFLFTTKLQHKNAWSLASAQKHYLSFPIFIALSFNITLKHRDVCLVSLCLFVHLFVRIRFHSSSPSLKQLPYEGRVTWGGQEQPLTGQPHPAVDWRLIKTRHFKMFSTLVFSHDFCCILFGLSDSECSCPGGPLSCRTLLFFCHG